MRSRWAADVFLGVVGTMRTRIRSRTTLAAYLRILH